MKYLAKIIGSAANGLMYVGAVFLLGLTFFTVGYIVYRLFGRVILGSYELTEFIIVVSVVFALAYTALRKGHLAVEIFVSRLPQRARAIVRNFTLAIGLVIWAS